MSIATIDGRFGQLSGSQLTTIILDEASDHAPAFLPLASVNQKLPEIAWTGINGGRSLNVATLEVDSSSRITGRFRDHALVAGDTLSGTTGPSMSKDSWPSDTSQVTVIDQNGTVYAAVQQGPQDVAFESRTVMYIAGTRGAAQRQMSWAGDGASLWTWTAADDGALCFALEPRTPGPQPPRVVRSAQTSAFAPALSSSHIAWTGTNGAGNLNAARINLTALQEGRDPILAVYTLPETSKAAPALLNYYVPGGPRLRLVILWTGSDDAGTLNACVLDDFS